MNSEPPQSQPPTLKSVNPDGLAAAPKYRNKYWKQIAGLAVLIIGLAAGTWLSFRSQDMRRQAAEGNVPQPPAIQEAAQEIRGDLVADIVIGKRNFGEIAPREIVSFKTFAPGGVVVDKSVYPGRMYVWDSGNNRILGINLANCYGEASACRADIVIGQPSLNDFGGCNLDSSFQTYPHRPPASAATICGVKEFTHTTLEDKSFSIMFVDRNGSLFVPDAYNNRVLKYISPFTTDVLADEVWGQDDFSGNECNKTGDMYNQIYPNPTSSSLCLQSDSDGNGVAFDSGGNLWIVDGGNNRILRFPKSDGGIVSKTADLVLGQPDFTSRGRGSQMNRMNAPAGLGFDQSGKLYVGDKNNNRILVFNPPFTIGKPADRVLASNLHYPFLQIDSQNRGVWVLNYSGSGEMKLFDFDGNLITSFALPNHSGGGVGFDAQNNILIPIYELLNDVLRYTYGPPPPRDRCASHDGNVDACNQDAGCAYYYCSDGCWLWGTPNEIACNILTENGYSASKSIFDSSYNGYNLTSARRLEHPALTGVAVTDSQLIVSDGRLLFWNNLANLVNGQSPDGYVGAAGFTDIPIPSFNQVKSDNDGRIWATNSNEIKIYQSPLTIGAQPVKRIVSPVETVDGRTLEFSGIIGLAAAPHGEYLWVSESDKHRVFRIINPLLDNPRVDVILGQKTLGGVYCNQDQNDPRNTDRWASPDRNNEKLDTLCYPGTLSLDKNQNLFISDHTVETAGNWRLLMFSNSLFPINNQQVTFAPPATKEFPRVKDGNIHSHMTFETAFDSLNRMVAGFNPYSGKRFIEYYLYPLRVNPQNPSDPEYAAPDGQFKDFYGWPTAMTFDRYDNLYAYDSNRGQVRIYKQPFLCNPLSGCSGSYPGFHYNFTPRFPSCTMPPSYPSNAGMPTPYYSAASFGDYTCSLAQCGGSCNNTVSGCSSTHSGYHYSFIPANYPACSVGTYTCGGSSWPNWAGEDSDCDFTNDNGDDYTRDLTCGAAACATPTPTPTPTSPINADPIIITEALPDGAVSSRYQAEVTGFDADAGFRGTITMSATGLPPGLKLSRNCQNTRERRGLRSVCPVSGVPLRTGIFPIVISVEDNRGGRSEKTLTLKIN